MNLLPNIPKDHILHTECKLRHIIYFYLLSTAQAREGILLCDLSPVDIIDKFRNCDEDDISDAIDSLEKDGLISINKDVIELGNVVEGRKQLYTGNVDNLETEIDKVYDYLESFLVDSVGSVKARVRRLSSQFSEMVKKPVENWSIYEMTQLFNICYSAYFQEFYRDFLDKEYNQVKVLCKLYGNKPVFKMIVYYIFNNEVFGKSLPTISSLQYHKDELFGKVNKVNKRGRAIRKTKIDDDF